VVLKGAAYIAPSPDDGAFVRRHLANDPGQIAAGDVFAVNFRNLDPVLVRDETAAGAEYDCKHEPTGMKKKGVGLHSQILRNSLPWVVIRYQCSTCRRAG